MEAVDAGTWPPTYLCLKAVAASALTSSRNTGAGVSAGAPGGGAGAMDSRHSLPVRPRLMPACQCVGCAYAMQCVSTALVGVCYPVCVDMIPPVPRAWHAYYSLLPLPSPSTQQLLPRI